VVELLAGHPITSLVLSICGFFCARWIGRVDTGLHEAQKAIQVHACRLVRLETIEGISDIGESL